MGEPTVITPAQGQQLSWVFRVLGVDLSALGLANASAAGGAAASTLPLPPEGVLERKGDGALFWQPNPAPVTWGTGSTPAPAGWVEGFLRYYDLAPAAAGAPATDCVFNQAPATVASVADLAAAQATLAGYKVAPASVQAAAQAILAERSAGRDAGAQIAKHEPDANDLATLRKLSTPALLDALEAARAGGRLEALAKQGTDRRVAAASLAVLHHLGAKWQGLMSGLPEADQQAIREHVYGRMLAGDVGDMTPLQKTGGGGAYAAPDVSDEDWVKGFLTFYGLGPDPLGDGSGSTCLFNSRTETLTDLLDIVAEQAAHAGRLIGRDVARKIAVPMLSPHVPPPPGSTHRFSYYLSYGFLPVTWHKDLKDGSDSHDPVAQQVGLQVTLELHPDDGSGPELSLVAQLSAFDDPKGGSFKVQNYLAGFQAAYVFAFFDGTLQLAPIAQALAGAARAQQAKDGSIKLVQTGQVLLGGQLVWAIPGTGKHLQIGVQSGASVTDPSGAHSTGDVPIQFIVQGKLP